MQDHCTTCHETFDENETIMHDSTAIVDEDECPYCHDRNCVIGGDSCAGCEEEQ